MRSNSVWMAYRSFLVDELFFVRWIAGVPDDLDVITEAVVARRAALGRPLIYVSIQDDATKTPDEAFAKRMLNRVPEFFDQLERIYLVVAVHGWGGNVQKRVLRAALATARTIDPERTGKVSLIESMGELFAALGVDPQRRAVLERELAEHRLLPDEA